jgi:hypothetical protein
MFDSEGRNVSLARLPWPGSRYSNYMKVNQGAAGVDGQTIVDFEVDLTNNIHEGLLIWVVGVALLVGATGLLIATAEQSKGPVFIAGDQPMTEDQVRQKLPFKRP